MGTNMRSAPDRRDPKRRPTRDSGELGRPLLVLNLKNYPSAWGSGSLRFGRWLETLSRQSGVACALAPPPFMLSEVARAVHVPVLSQHVDDVSSGATTGWLTAESLKGAGGRGSLVSHSEHRLSLDGIQARCRRLASAGLVSVVCVDEERRAWRIAERVRPPYLAVEPPDLIGGRVSVSQARPEIISRTAEGVHRRSGRTVVLCGAGIHEARDVRRALELGAQGILVSSAVANAPEPRRALERLLRGFAAAP
jgi:triosephosphate isomerase